MALVRTTDEITLRKKQKVVLDEDTYLDTLESIIERDYYPDLKKLRAQNEYLDALQRQDVEEIRRIQMKYSRRRTDLAGALDTPANFETPSTSKQRRKNTDTADGSWARPNTGFSDVINKPATDNRMASSNAPTTELSQPEFKSVDKFLNECTSEDNHSFQEVMDLENVKRRQRMKWIYDAEIEHHLKYRHLNALALEGPAGGQGGDDSVQLAIAAAPSSVAFNKTLQTWDYHAFNPVLWVPQDAPLTLEEKIQRSKMAERQIITANTRFGENPFSNRNLHSKVLSLNSADRGKVDVLGETKGFNLVSTPTPVPGQGIDESPMMFWGEIEGTPFRLDGSDTLSSVLGTPGPTFKMPEVPTRDLVAQSLVDKNNTQYRMRKQKAVIQVSHGVRTRPGNSTVERLSGMSPAAKRLATTKLGIRIGSDKQLKASYTPSPIRRDTGDRRTPRGSSLTPVSAGGVGSSMKTPNRVSNSPVGLTDNLLMFKSERKQLSTATDECNTPSSGSHAVANRSIASDFF